MRLGKRFLQLLDGAPASVWLSIICYNTMVSDHIFGYSPSECKLISPPASASWVLMWVLLHFSPKHRFLSIKLLDMQWVAQDSWNAMQKMLWQSHCSKSSSTPPFVKHAKLDRVNQCSPMAGSLEERWCSHFRRVLLDVCSANRNHFSESSSNIFGLIDLGVKELRNSGFNFVPLDKQPGYVIVTPEQFSEMELYALPGKYYIPFPISQVNFDSILRIHNQLAKDIADFHGDPRLVANIKSSLASGTFVSPLTITVKAHKPSGQQGLRTIHRGFNPSFYCLSTWVVRTLEPLMCQIPWAHKDSFSVRKELVSFCGSKFTCIAKLDLKDFFLCGKSYNIATSVSSLLPDKVLASLMHRAIYFLLENQFIITCTLAHTYRCHTGSGIGLLISAVLANLFFYVEVERDWVRSQAGMCSWIRYHDDVIAIFSCRELLRSGISALKKRAEPVFKVVCEGVFSCGTTFEFLDLSVHVFARAACDSPRFRVTAAQNKPLTPLCPSSAHFGPVHKSWPAAVANRTSVLSGNSLDSHLLLCSRYRSVCTHTYTLNLLEGWKPQACASLESKEAEKSDGTRKVPFVFRYHPCVAYAMNRTLKLVPPPPELCLRPRASWRNSLPSLHSLINRANRVSLSRDGIDRVGRCFLLSNLQDNVLSDFVLRNLHESMHV